MMNYTNGPLSLFADGKPRSKFFIQREPACLACTLDMRWRRNWHRELLCLLVVWDKIRHGSPSMYHMQRDGVMRLSLSPMEFPGGKRTFGEVSISNSGQFSTWFGRYSENSSPDTCGTQFEVFCETDLNTLAYCQISYCKPMDDAKTYLADMLASLTCKNPCQSQRGISQFGKIGWWGCYWLLACLAGSD